MSATTSSVPPSRGPADHAVRDQIVEAANEHFSRYGYEKTTVSDLAKSIGFSKAYIYKFFDSKQAIGEAICAKTLRGIVATVEEAVAGATTPTEKFRRMFKILVTTNVSLFFNDRKLYDVAAYAAGEQWPSARAYCERLRQIVSEIVREGAGERRVRAQDPARRDGACDRSRHAALCESAPPPVHLDVAEEAPVQLSNLVLRSLAT